MTERLACVLDTSALLAFLNDEPGGSNVERRLPGSVFSAVNYSELCQKRLSRGMPVEHLRSNLATLGIAIAPFTPAYAELAAALWPVTRKHGLSLADRACLALGLALDLPVVTAERVWASLHVAIKIETIR